MLYWSLKQLRQYFLANCNWLKGNIFIGEPAGGLIAESNMPAVIIEPERTRHETNDNQREMIYYDIIVWLVVNEKSLRGEKYTENKAVTEITELMEGASKSTTTFRNDTIVAQLLNAKQDGIGENWWVWEVGDVDYGLNTRGKIHTREAQVKVTITQLKTRDIT